MTLALWVDPQYDFTRGVLAAPYSHSRIVAINTFMRRPDGEFTFVASRCQHTPETDKKHFDTYGEHCVVGTQGAEWDPRLEHAYLRHVINKGKTEADPSPWDGATGSSKTLEQLCNEDGSNEIVIGGFVAEVCVDAAIDGALERGFKVRVPVGTVGYIRPLTFTQYLMSWTKKGVELF